MAHHGEHRPLHAGVLDRIRPKKEFRPRDGFRGAFELAFRSGHEDLTQSPGKRAGNGAATCTTAPNWHLTSNIKVRVNRVRFSGVNTPMDQGGVTKGDAVAGRFHIDFQAVAGLGLRGGQRARGMRGRCAVRPSAGGAVGLGRRFVTLFGHPAPSADHVPSVGNARMLALAGACDFRHDAAGPLPFVFRRLKIGKAVEGGVAREVDQRRLAMDQVGHDLGPHAAEGLRLLEQSVGTFQPVSPDAPLRIGRQHEHPG